LQKSSKDINWYPLTSSRQAGSSTTKTIRLGASDEEDKETWLLTRGMTSRPNPPAPKTPIKFCITDECRNKSGPELKERQ
jgi:hypothetical protein